MNPARERPAKASRLFLFLVAGLAALAGILCLLAGLLIWVLTLLAGLLVWLLTLLTWFIVGHRNLHGEISL
jgi:fatty acid desaturase